MKVKDLLNDIKQCILNDTLNLNSKVTVHVYTKDGEAVEWTDIEPEYHGESDGYEINVDGEGTIFRQGYNSWAVTDDTIDFMKNHQRFTWDFYWQIKQEMQECNGDYNKWLSCKGFNYSELGLTAQQIQDICYNRI